MADRPLRPATDRRLGRPLPYQLANPTSAHPSTRGLATPAFPRRAYAVLANLSTGYSPSLGRFRSIAHPFAARQHVLLRLLPLDLHVLGTPPAFNLSQDQTLHLKILSFNKKSIQKAQLLAGLNWSLGHLRQRHIDASPHTNYLQIIKEHLGRGGPRKGAGSIALGQHPSRICNRLIPRPEPAF